MKKAAVVLAFAFASIALVSCGGSSNDSSTTTTTSSSRTTAEKGADGGAKAGGAAEGSVVDIAAAPRGLAYTSDRVSAKAGKITVNFTNPQPLKHNVTLVRPSGWGINSTDQIAEGSDSFVVHLKPGTYTYYCFVPGHRNAGMEGTLIVK